MRASGPGLSARPALPFLRASLRALATHATALAVGGGATLVFLANARSYLPFFADDGFISLRYSARLLAGEGLTWTDGERVEGYSNLLWVLGCALIGALHVDLVHAARILGVLGGIAAIGAIVFFYRPRSWDTALPSVAGTLALAVAGPLAAWAVGGLEQGLAAGLLAWGALLTVRLAEDETATPRSAIAAGVVLGLMCWTRPDAPLFVAGVGLGVLVARRLRPRAFALVGVLGAVAGAFVAAQLAFRLAYYHEWVPNTALAKVAFTKARATGGAEYVGGAEKWLAALGALAVVATLGALASKRRRGAALVLALPLLLWCAYVVVIGGDIFPARRHLVPAIVLLALLAANGLAAVIEAWPERQPLAWGLTLTSLGVFAFAQLVDPEDIRARDETFEWEGLPIATLLRTHFGESKPLVAIDAAGSLPYFSELPSLDMLGLNDRWLATHRPPDFGSKYLGHELGNGQYVWDRNPDLVVFWVPAGDDHGHFRSGIELQHHADFAARFSLVTFETWRPSFYRSRIYVNRSSPKVGIRRDDRGIFVPGYLFAGGTRDVAREDAAGKLGAMVTLDVPGRVERIEVPAGRWRAHVSSCGARVATTITRSPRGPITTTDDDLSFEMAAAGVIEVQVKPSEGALAHVEALVLTPVPFQSSPP